jgi:RNA polymerase sigma-70 factor (ECF subfamily)
MAVNILPRPDSRSGERVIDGEPLLGRCVRGQPDAWRELYRRYHPMAHNFLRRLGVPPAVLDDACQDVFVQVFRYLARFEARAAFTTWLYRLCLTQARQVRRSATVRSLVGRVLGRALPAAAAPHEWTEADSEMRVRQALAAMKPIHREVFVLYELEGLAGEQIAAITGLPPGTVRRRLHDARAAFRSLLDAT